MFHKSKIVLKILIYYCNHNVFRIAHAWIYIATGIRSIAHGYDSHSRVIDLKTATQVFVRYYAVNPYGRPYKVVRKNDKKFVIKIQSREVTIPVEKLKLAYFFTRPVPLATAVEDQNLPWKRTVPVGLPSALAEQISNQLHVA